MIGGTAVPWLLPCRNGDCAISRLGDPLDPRMLAGEKGQDEWNGWREQFGLP